MQATSCSPPFQVSFPQKRSCTQPVSPADTSFLLNPHQKIKIPKFKFISALFIGMLLSGCQGALVELTEVLNYSSCKSLPEGASWVEFNDLAKIRGATMDAELPVPDHKFLAISNGTLPTGGYAFSLQSFTADDANIVLSLKWVQPDPDSMQVEALTSPCLVIGIATSAAIDAVVVHLDDEPFATLGYPSLEG